MKKTVCVDLLPELDQLQFPLLPKPLSGVGILTPIGTKLKKTEKEIVLGILLTAAVQNGKWHAVSTTSFMQIASKSIPSPFIPGVINAVWDLFKEKLVEMITFRQEDYVVPTPALAEIARNAQCINKSNC